MALVSCFKLYTKIHAVHALKISSNYRRKGNNTQQQISFYIFEKKFQLCLDIMPIC